MKFVVTELNNFGRVFRMPFDYPSDFCFGGGHPIQVQLVDWFNPVPPDEGEYFVKYPKTLEGEELEKLRDRLREWLKEKVYVKANVHQKFILVTDYGDAIVVNP